MNCAPQRFPSVEPMLAEDNASSLTHTLAPLRPILDNPRVTEVCINRPQEVFIQSYDGWSSERLALRRLLLVSRLREARGQRHQAARG
jgi:type IV secretory pathway ATPase VirB11/archaellum biosynthesis ATPase